MSTHCCWRLHPSQPCFSPAQEIIMSQTVSMMGSNGHNSRNIQQSEHLTRIIPVEVPAHVLEDDPGGVHVAVGVHRLGVAGVSAVRGVVPRDNVQH